MSRRFEPATAVRSLGLLREAFWLRLLVAVAVLSVAFVFLGRWQLHRHEAKVARNAAIDANYDATPVPVDAVLTGPASPLPAGRQWTRVALSGTYEPGGTTLVRNRPYDGDYGFEIVVPLRLATGAAVLVDRGWVPSADDFVQPESVPAPPSGPVQVVVRLRPFEPRLAGEEPPAGQARSIEEARPAARAGGTVYSGAYGVLAAEDPAPATAPRPLPRPDEDLGPHLAYAVQWWIGAAAAWGLLGYYLYAEAEHRAAGGTPGERPSPRSGPARPARRRELTDEEYEDAATG